MTDQTDRRQTQADLKRARRTQRIREHTPTLNRSLQRELKEQDRHLKEIEEERAYGETAQTNI